MKIRLFGREVLEITRPGKTKNRADDWAAAMSGGDDAVGSTAALKISAVFRQKLRHNRDPLVPFRKDIPQSPGRKPPIRGGGEERSVISVHAGKHVVMDLAEDEISDPFHGGKIKFHKIPP